MRCRSAVETYWLRKCGLAAVVAVAAAAWVTAAPPERTYFESFEDPLGAGLTIDGPGGLSTQPCPAGASQSEPLCVRGQRISVDGPVCPSDQTNVTPLTGVILDPSRNGWHVHTANTPDLSGTGKAHGGQNSLHWGRHVFIDNRGTNNDIVGDTYGLETINVFVGPDLNLAKGGRSIMSFWHIAEFCDTDCWAFEPDTGDDYAIVEVRADLDRNPNSTAWSAWERVTPFFGPYDGLQDTLYSSPTFDPGDDTNPFDAANPDITMCRPNTVFLSQGSARGTDAVNCTDGDGNGFPDCGHGELENNPALRTADHVSRGSVGVGVWVQAKINLRRYAGEHIQYRFVATTLDDSLDIFISYLENYSGTGAPAISPSLDIDDGWYIDEVTITGTKATE